MVIIEWVSLYLHSLHPLQIKYANHILIEGKYEVEIDLSCPMHQR